jgi:hypothetical protein
LYVSSRKRQKNKATEVVEPPRFSVSLTDLPTELLFVIFSDLCPSDLLCLASLSRRFNYLALISYIKLLQSTPAPHTVDVQQFQGVDAYLGPFKLDARFLGVLRIALFPRSLTSVYCAFLRVEGDLARIREVGRVVNRMDRVESVTLWFDRAAHQVDSMAEPHKERELTTLKERMDAFLTLLDVLSSKGCTDLHFNGHQNVDVHAHDVSPTSISPQPWKNLTHFTLASSVPFSPPLREWTLATINACPLNTLVLDCQHLDIKDWEEILVSVECVTLEELQITAGMGRLGRGKELWDFLTRHELGEVRVWEYNLRDIALTSSSIEAVDDLGLDEDEAPH